MKADRAGRVAFYRDYLQTCNEHRFHDLGRYVAESVQVNGVAGGLRSYIDGLAGVAEAFPDFHWDLQHLLVDGIWLGAHLIDTATRPDGSSLTVPEFAIYRIEDDRIAAVWGDLDADRLTAA